MPKILNPPLKWHGGKHDLAKWLIFLMPPRCQNPDKPDPDDLGWLHYVEPYFGGGAVLLANDPEGISEVVNDLNGQLVNFWQVLREPSAFEQFRRYAEATPFGEPEFAKSKDWLLRYGDAKGLQVPRAYNFFIRCRQSLAGRMRGFTGITKTRTRRGMNNEVSAWLTCIDGLPAVHDRLKRVLIVGPDDALNVIRKHDGPRTLFYLDPPYLHETRATTGEYAHEMTYEQHRELLEILKSIKGRFLLSWYDSDLYRSYANTTPRWNRYEKRINNHAAGGKTKRVMTECVWINY